MKQADLQTESGIAVRIFYGCPLLPDLRAQLDRSQAWKLAQIDGGKTNSVPAIVRHHDKDYFGSYLSDAEATIAVIEAEEKRIHNKINEFCPELDIDALTFTLFPIVLIK